MTVSTAPVILRAPLLLLFFLFFLFREADVSGFQSAQSAQSAQTAQSARTSALGGAGHAGPLFTDALYLNPSFIPMLPVRALSLVTSLPGPETGSNPTISLQDGTRDVLVPWGVGVTYGREVSMLNIGAATGISSRLAIGMSARYRAPNATLASGVVEAALSCSGIVSDGFRVSFTVDNLLEAGSGQDAYREFILGTKLSLGSVLNLYVDPLWVPALAPAQSEWGYEVGAELPLFDLIFLRAGVFRNATLPMLAQRGEGFGVGLGVLAAQFSLDYAYSGVLRPDFSGVHRFGVNIYF